MTRFFTFRETPGTPLDGHIYAAAAPRLIAISGYCEEEVDIPDLALDRSDGRLIRVSPRGPVSTEIAGRFACEDGWAVEEVMPFAELLGPQARELAAAVGQAEGAPLHGDPEAGPVAAAYYQAADDAYPQTHVAEHAAVEALGVAGVDSWWWQRGFACTYGPEMVGLAARDLVGSTASWTWDAYLTLAGPWVAAFGAPLHPGDPAVTARLEGQR